jgi:hypothetical protein
MDGKRMFDAYRFAMYTVIVSALVAGCTPKPFIRSVQMGTVSAVSLDIKQRMVFSAPHLTKDTEGHYQLNANSPTIVCPEPSPDALTAATATIDLKASGAEKALSNLQASASTSENAAFVGLRTQSIQLLRDQLTHLCLGYMNGALDQSAYYLLIRRQQRLTLGLLAVEQITGAWVAQAQVVTAPTAKADTSAPGIPTTGTPKTAAPSTGASTTGSTPSTGTPTEGAPSRGTATTGANRTESLSSTPQSQPVVGMTTSPQFIRVGTASQTTPSAAEPKAPPTKSPGQATGKGSVNPPSTTPGKPADPAAPASDGTNKNGGAGAGAGSEAIGKIVEQIVSDVLTKGFEEEECLSLIAQIAGSSFDNRSQTSDWALGYCQQVFQAGPTAAMSAGTGTGIGTDTIPKPDTASGSGSATSAPSQSSGKPSSSSSKGSTGPSAADSVQHAEARTSEAQGYAELEAGDYPSARKSFADAEAKYPGLGNARELSSVLSTIKAGDSATTCAALTKILTGYSWHLPTATGVAIRGQLRSGGCKVANSVL